ncbi:hypothetical protein AA0488_2747 [Kozakia baliensis NRIC 0488]|nr:hypothetical protein AA0488_2747 [Kozakia baliensis NRIC 0488]
MLDPTMQNRQTYIDDEHRYGKNGRPKAYSSRNKKRKHAKNEKNTPRHALEQTKLARNIFENMLGIPRQPECEGTRENEHASD